SLPPPVLVSVLILEALERFSESRRSSGSSGVMAPSSPCGQMSIMRREATTLQTGSLASDTRERVPQLLNASCRMGA
ncbi:MAG TPA: hypothetical protein PKY27_13205, partial [Arachnia sp.]|nr:hypothetical protein [Arachnia sp.]